MGMSLVICTVLGKHVFGNVNNTSLVPLPVPVSIVVLWPGDEAQHTNGSCV